MNLPNSATASGLCCTKPQEAFNIIRNTFSLGSFKCIEFATQLNNLSCNCVQIFRACMGVKLGLSHRERNIG